MIRLLASLVLVACTAPLGATVASGVCGDDVDAAELAMDAAVDAALDAAAAIDPGAPWDLVPIVPWADCKGADGVSLKVMPDGRIKGVSACEGAATVVEWEQVAACSLSFTHRTIATSLQGAEEAIWVDWDGGLDDVVVAASGKLAILTGNASGTFTKTIIDTGQYFHEVVEMGPGDVVAGGYGTLASIKRYVRSVAGGASITTIGAVEYTKEFLLRAAELLVFDSTGPLAGARDVFTGASYSSDGDTQAGCLFDGQLVTGAANAAGSLIRVGSTTIPYPANFGWYHACVQIEDGIAVQASHADGALSSIVWLRRVVVDGVPTWIRYEVSGADGVKGDNLAKHDLNCDGREDIIGTEEKTGGVFTRLFPEGALWP